MIYPSHFVYPVWLWPPWYSLEPSNLLKFTSLKPLNVCFFFFPFLSFYAWPFPISGIQKDLTSHLKVALSSLFSLCILFVSFIASQQFAAILYPCICCLLPPVQVHEASPCSFRPRAALGAQQIFGEWMNESMRNRTGTWRAGWWAVNSRPLLDNMEGNPG